MYRRRLNKAFTGKKEKERVGAWRADAARVFLDRFEVNTKPLGSDLRGCRHMQLHVDGFRLETAPARMAQTPLFVTDLFGGTGTSYREIERVRLGNI